MNSQPASAPDRATPPAAASAVAEAQPQAAAAGAAADPVLCGHCGRTASNGLVCIGMCVADSGY